MSKVEPKNLEDDPKYFKDFKLTRRFPKNAFAFKNVC